MVVMAGSYRPPLTARRGLGPRHSPVAPGHVVRFALEVLRKDMGARRHPSAPSMPYEARARHAPAIEPSAISIVKIIGAVKKNRHARNASTTNTIANAQEMNCRRRSVSLGSRLSCQAQRRFDRSMWCSWGESHG